MIERHESLRTIFIEIDGAPVQQIVPAALAVPFDCHRLARTTAAGSPATEQLIAQDARQPDALGDAPLMRASLLRLEEQEFVLLLNFLGIDFIVCDAASLVIFYRELGQLYDGLLVTRTATNFPTLRVRSTPTLPRGRRVNWRSPALAAQLDYWKARLDDGCPRWICRRILPGLPCKLIVARSARGVCRERSARRSRRSGAKGSDAIHGVARGAEHFVGALERTTKTSSSARRSQAGRGWNGMESSDFSSMRLALRSDLSGAPTFNETARSCPRSVPGRLHPSGFALRARGGSAQPAGGRDPGRNPIFQSLFNLAERGERELKLKGL